MKSTVKLKKILIALTMLLLFVSCTSAPKESTLAYTWDETEKTTYAFLKKHDEESLNALLESYKKCVEVSNLNGNPIIEEYEGKQIETRCGTPPGICADYGYLLIKTGRVTEGKEMLKKEIELYPESEKFIKKLLESLE